MVERNRDKRTSSSRWRYAGLLLVAGMMSAPPLLASSRDTIKDRAVGYRAIGAAFKKANDELRSGSPDIAVVRSSASAISKTVAGQHLWFPAGSGPAVGVKTRAKRDIWTNPADFKAAQNAMAARANAFLKASRGRDADAMRQAAKELGATCTGCHRRFREE